MSSTRKKKCKIFLVTVSTKEHSNLDRFIKSAKVHGFSPKIRGLHENKKYKDPIFGMSADFGMKLRYLYNECKRLKPNDIILFTDSWDVVIIGDCDKIYKEYKSFKKDIVIGGEYAFINFDYNTFNIVKYHSTKPFPCLNSGVIIGKAGTIYKLLDDYTKGEIVDKTDDQEVWREIYKKNKDKIAIDVSAKIILNTCFTTITDYIYVDNVFTYKPTNTQPSIIHAQGHEYFGNKIYLDYIKY